MIKARTRLCGGAARQGLGQGQAGAHLRPGGARREWGSGRRTGSLSNLHLGAREPDGGEPIMVGKTFKGMTDELLRPGRPAVPRPRPRGSRGHAGCLRPELVVEIALEATSGSPRYPGGVALRFDHGVRYRPDKSPAEADTIDAVRSMRESLFSTVRYLDGQTPRARPHLRRRLPRPRPFGGGLPVDVDLTTRTAPARPSPRRRQHDRRGRPADGRDHRPPRRPRRDPAGHPADASPTSSRG